MSTSTSTLSLVRSAIQRKSSAGGIGFAGTSGLVASGLTDLASVLGPILFWAFILSCLAAIVLAVLIARDERAMATTGQEPGRLGLYCHSLLVLLGVLFGAGVLLITGLFQEDTGGSRILALLSETKATVERVETKVDTANDQLSGIGQKVILMDISGRSGTGMIGDISTFQISMENEKLMESASCKVAIDPKWKSVTEVLSSDCSAFKVQLAKAPLLNDDGESLGDIVQIPYDITVTAKDGAVIGEASGVYPFNNQYRSVKLKLEPSGNRLKVNERRRVEVITPDADIPAGTECEWNDSTNPIIRFISDSPNNCSGWLSTEADADSYAYKDLMASREKKGTLYIQIVTSSDFKMLGIGEASFKVSK